MECRGVVSAYDERADSITIWSSRQVVHWLRREASTVLNMPEARIRCVALDVGGGFGVKGPRLSRGIADSVPRARA